jgi:hypothetical protein
MKVIDETKKHQQYEVLNGRITELRRRRLNDLLIDNKKGFGYLFVLFLNIFEKETALWRHQWQIQKAKDLSS